MKLTEIKRTIRDYHEQLYANQLDNWGNGQISNIRKVWFHFFDVWLLKSFRPHSSLFLLCPTSDKADKKAQVLFHLPLMRWLNSTRAHLLQVGALIPASFSNHHKNSTSASFSSLSSHFSDQVGKPALFSTESLFM